MIHLDIGDKLKLVNSASEGYIQELTLGVTLTAWDYHDTAVAVEAV